MKTVPLIGVDVIHRPKPNVQVSYGAMTMAPSTKKVTASALHRPCLQASGADAAGWGHPGRRDAEWRRHCEARNNPENRRIGSFASFAQFVLSERSLTFGFAPTTSLCLLRISATSRHEDTSSPLRGPSVTKKSRPIGSIVKDAPVGANKARICSSR